MILKLLSLIFIGGVALNAAAAIDFPASQVRLFAGAQTSSPDQVNNVIEPAGLEKFKTVGTYGVEALYRPVDAIGLGLRYVGKYAKVKETASPSANPNNPYYSALQTSAFMGSVRISLLSTSFLLLDVFGAAGAQKGTLDVRTAGGEGVYDASSASELVTQYGASLGIGFANVHLFVEVGQEQSALKNFTRKGVTSTNIEEINTGGPLFLFGVSFRPGKTKK